ncbi:3-oxoacyl-(acyl carrier protein) synthase [Caballeronia arvi]|uniref:3-oxoacyl-(Acyl carrier protein) synthase n=2 Tax=Caballeronia arvi TaxID=1777135 RepID=A0A158F556_9BURK|nr:3-oxoacyl-(acyl carrier protein) synthase [Caballeronia arvi]
MNDRAIAILNTGLVTSVGLSAPASCAAIRAKISNPTETRFIGSDGEWIMAHQVQLQKPWRGRTKLTKMAAMAIKECLAGLERDEWAQIPLLLCVAEGGRPGRIDGLDDLLFEEIAQELSADFHAESAVFAHGRVSAAIALERARSMLSDSVPRVLIAAADSLLGWPTLSVYQRQGRLLGAENSNGFIAGEGAGALLVGLDNGEDRPLCIGIGFGTERAAIDSDKPLRGDGLTFAIKAALTDAGCALHELDFRVTDLSGEQYYFKEASIALSRSLRAHKESLPLWHPAECCGEGGAIAGPVCVAVAGRAMPTGYAPGPAALLHFSADDGARAALVMNGGRAHG